MDYLFQDGGKHMKTKSKTKSKSKTGTKTSTKTKTGTKTATKSKTSTKTGTKTTKSKSSSKKGGNFLGAVGDLVAPTGWGPFATAAGLLALDRADSALRRGKSSAKKGGSNMRGGTTEDDVDALLSTDAAFLNKLKQNWSTAYSVSVAARSETPIHLEEIENEIDREILKRKQLLDIVIDEYKKHESIKKKLIKSISRLEQESQKNSKSSYRRAKNFKNIYNEKLALRNKTNETRGLFD